MNKSRQSKLDKLIAQLETIKEKLEKIQSEEQEFYDNLSDTAQDGDKGETSQNAIDGMEEGINNIDHVIDTITGLN